MTKKSEDYVENYLESANRLGIPIESILQSIKKTAEAAWVVDSYPIEVYDEPAEKSPRRRVS